MQGAAHDTLWIPQTDKAQNCCSRRDWGSVRNPLWKTNAPFFLGFSLVWANLIFSCTPWGILWDPAILMVLYMQSVIWINSTQALEISSPMFQLHVFLKSGANRLSDSDCGFPHSRFLCTSATRGHAVGIGGATQHRWGAVVAHERAVVTSSNACSCSSCCWRISNCLCSSSSCLRIYSWTACRHKKIEIDRKSRNLNVQTLAERENTDRKRNREDNLLRWLWMRREDESQAKRRRPRSWTVVMRYKGKMTKRQRKEKRGLNMSFQNTRKAWEESNRAIRREQDGHKIHTRAVGSMRGQGGKRCRERCRMIISHQVFLCIPGNISLFLHGSCTNRGAMNKAREAFVEINLISLRNYSATQRCLLWKPRTAALAIHLWMPLYGDHEVIISLSRDNKAHFLTQTG